VEDGIDAFVVDERRGDFELTAARQDAAGRDEVRDRLAKPARIRRWHCGELPHFGRE
jgi:hypothetical protein